MPFVSKSLFAAAAVGIVLAGSAGLSGAGGPAPPPAEASAIRDVTRHSDLETRIDAALQAETDINAPDHKLSQALQMVADHHGINVVFHSIPKELEETRVSASLSGITLRSALKILLESAAGDQLDYYIDNDAVNVTLRSKAEKHHLVRVYDVKPLLRDGVTIADVAGIVTEFAIPRGSPKAMPLGNQVAVSHNRHVHEKVLEVLNRLCSETAEAK